ncbi:hypothetical protein SLEP1_g57957 [Rubroshorea leprosula]|uniref:Uncharacterized protein n=1 Tax=Rubroshorea leprosula TaxID=152421 RepID=A0AAV5MNX3_9ROSI|nr:hypothetical protein SLEP1_g57957 [Rubroshorea leprosula]
MVKSFEQLEVLKIYGCKEMQVVILIEELVEKEKTSQTMFPKLDRLELCYLPQLVRFCSNCNSFGEVYEAQGLSGSGSQVVAAAQSKLVETEVTRLVFPRVTFLALSRLSNFKGFFPKIHITKWPLLKRMLLEQCAKVKTFASEFPSIQITFGDNQLERQTQDPMFWIGKDSFSCLEELKFQQNDNMKEIWREIVKCLEDNVKDGIVFSQLKSLQLRGLPKLSSFCTRRCNFEFPSLKEAIVIRCPQMKYFSMGKTITKELQNVQWSVDKEKQNVQWTNDEEKRHWAGDLDSTIQYLFTQKI